MEAFWDMVSIENGSRKLTTALAYYLIFEVSLIAQHYGYRTAEAAFNELSRSVTVTSRNAFLAALKSEASLTETATFSTAKIHSLDPSITFISKLYILNLLQDRPHRNLP